jgi:hypothetical protein
MANVLLPGKAANIHFVLAPGDLPYFVAFEGDFSRIDREAFWPCASVMKWHDYPWDLDPMAILEPGADIILRVKNQSAVPQEVPDVALRLGSARPGTTGRTEQTIASTRVELL